MWNVLEVVGWIWLGASLWHFFNLYEEAARELSIMENILSNDWFDVILKLTIFIVYSFVHTARMTIIGLWNVYKPMLTTWSGWLTIIFIVGVTQLSAWEVFPAWVVFEIVKLCFYGFVSSDTYVVLCNWFKVNLSRLEKAFIADDPYDPYGD